MTATQAAESRRRVSLALVLILLCVGVLAPSLSAAGPAPSSQAAWIESETWGPWMQLLGRLHPVFVHFPIGLLIAAGIVEVLGARRQGPRPGNATLTCLTLGWLAAALAAYSGWTYAAIERHGHGADGLLFWHRWGGVAVAGAGFLAWVFALLGRSGKRPRARGAFFFFLFVTTVLTGVVGHLGGSLVWGEDYLSEPFSAAERDRRARRSEPGEPSSDSTTESPVAPAQGQESDRPGGLQDPGQSESSAQGGAAEGAPGDGASAVVASGDAALSAADPSGAEAAYRAVQPIFEVTCTHCHGPRKGKAGLRLHEVERLFEGDPVDWVVVPGHPEKSELVRRISLPLDHEDSMPSDDDPLPADEVALIRRWVEALDPQTFGLPPDGGNAGSAILGDWGDVPQSGPADLPVDVPDPLPVEPPVEPPVGDPTPKSEGEASVETEQGEDLSGGGAALSSPTDLEEVLVRLRARGAVAQPVARGTSQIEVAFGLLGAAAGDEDLELLRGLETELVALDLARTAVTDAGIAGLARFRRLGRLHLEETRITDAGLAHLSGLTDLTYLNLYGTDVSDAGLQSLAGLTQLQKLYLWQTAVSDAAVDGLQVTLPGLEIIRDAVLSDPPPPLVVTEGEIRFDEHIAPILEVKCLECHGVEDPAAGLSFTSFEVLFEGPWAEWAVRPGEPESSRMLRAVQREPGSKNAMPKQGERLTSDETELLTDWIAGLREVEESVLGREEVPETGGL